MTHTALILLPPLLPYLSICPTNALIHPVAYCQAISTFLYVLFSSFFFTLPTSSVANSFFPTNLALHSSSTPNLVCSG